MSDADELIEAQRELIAAQRERLELGDRLIAALRAEGQARQRQVTLLLEQVALLRRRNAALRFQAAARGEGLGS